MKNKILAVILTIALLFSTVSMTAMATDPVTEEIVNEEIVIEEIVNEEIVNEEIVAEEIVTEEIVTEEIVNEEIVTEEIQLAQDTVEEEDINLQSAVTANLSGSDISGATNVALSIRLVVTFPTALAAGTDISGITLTGGTAPVELILTPGSTTEAFTKVTVETPELENATTYTLNIPALGENEAASFTFTTVPNGYIAKEEFDNRYTSYIAQKQDGSTAAGTNILTDTNSDGVKDSVTMGGNSYTTLMFPQGIKIGDADQTMIEARVKWKKGSGGSSLANADGTFKGTGNDSNYGLFSFRGSTKTAGNNQGHVMTKSSGNMSYGGRNVSGSGGDYDTGYKIYANTWYTVRIAFNSSMKKFSVYIVDDAGNAFQGTAQNTRWSGYEVNPLFSVYFSYNYYIQATVDYVHVWRNGSFSDVTATYGAGQDLNGASNILKNGVTATLKFENDITQADLANITSNAGSTVATLVDSKTVSLKMTGFEYGTSYVVNVNQFGANKAKTFKFTTEAAPVELEAGDYSFKLVDGTAATGLTAVRADGSIEYLMDSDLLSANPLSYNDATLVDEEGNNIPFTIKESGGGKYVAYVNKGFEYGKTYIFKYPTSQTDESGNLRPKRIEFTTEDKPLVATADPVIISGSSVTATASVTDNTGLTNNIKAMLVVYNAAGNIIKVSAQDMTLNAGVNPIALTATASGAYQAKLYIWGGANGMSNLVPLQ